MIFHILVKQLRLVPLLHVIKRAGARACGGCSKSGTREDRALNNSGTAVCNLRFAPRDGWSARSYLLRARCGQRGGGARAHFLLLLSAHTPYHFAVIQGVVKLAALMGALGNKEAFDGRKSADRFFSPLRTPSASVSGCRCLLCWQTSNKKVHLRCQLGRKNQRQKKEEEDRRAFNGNDHACATWRGQVWFGFLLMSALIINQY